MDQDSVKYDSLDNRPLPKWLTDQKEGLTAYQPPKIIIKADKSLYVSFGLTTLFIILLVTFLTVVIIKKKKNHIK